MHQERPDLDVSSETLSDAFRSVARVLRQVSVESLARWDVTPSQSRAMRVLMRHGMMRLTELAEHLRIAPRSTTEVVDDLEAKGLIERGRDPKDRRATQVALTERGIQVSRAIKAESGADTERVFDRLSPADREHLTRILRALRD